MIVVKEEWIALAILRLVELEKCVVEGAGVYLNKLFLLTIMQLIVNFNQRGRWIGSYFGWALG